MGRFDTLNADTQDLVNCLLPALATSFGVTDCVDIIPEDIRMRAWDCERRDHIKDQTENDPRNWGVQFLKDLKAISRITGGDLSTFQKDIRAKVALHEPKHPWCRLGDVKELKDQYENPNRRPPVEIESAGTSSTDSYLEELHELDLPRGTKRGRQHELYEARVQESHKARKYGSHGRLRRSDDGVFIRKDKKKGKGRASIDRRTPGSARHNVHRPSRTVYSDDEDSYGSGNGMAHSAHPAPTFSMSPNPPRAPSAVIDTVNASDQPLHIQKMQAELEVAEAELRTARVRYEYINAREQAEKYAKNGRLGNGGVHQSYN